MLNKNSIVGFIFVCLLTACSESDHIVIYTSHDRNLSEPILNAFTKKTGIQVKPVYDTEANKTTGLVNRLIAEKQRPRADVFWNNEVGRTVGLQQKELLAPYISTLMHDRASQYYDMDGHWAGFAARARVLIANTDLTQENQPIGLMSFTDPQWQGKAAIADPHFGTTGTHFSALYTLWGKSQFRDWLRLLKANQVSILPGNAQVKNKVAAGEFAFGLTDTDDANAALLDGKPVNIIFPDQSDTGLGLFVIPNTVALINGAPHADLAKQLIDYLLSKEVEAMLAKNRGAQIPLQAGVPGPKNLPPLSELKQMQVSYQAIADNFEAMLAVFREEWPQ